MIYLPQSLLLRDARDTAMSGHDFQEVRVVRKYSCCSWTLWVGLALLWLTQARVPVLPAEKRKGRNIFVHSDFFTGLQNAKKTQHQRGYSHSSILSVS
jgi:hypothetical protein